MEKNRVNRVNRVDHVCKQEIIISNVMPKSAGIAFRVNMPPGMQLAYYKLGRHKSSIRPRLSVAYMSLSNSIAPSKRGFVVHWGLSQQFGQALQYMRGRKGFPLTSYM